MERLHDLLVEYNRTIPEQYRTSWSKQFLAPEFPYYWRLTFQVLFHIDRHKYVVEIGAGQGDVTAILCYLGFSSVSSYERDFNTAQIASDKIKTLFHSEGIIKAQNFRSENCISEDADVLVIVNCAYVDGCKSKEEYLSKLLSFYESSGCPSLVLLEVIDETYKVDDADFPRWIRLNNSDISSLFPKAIIQSFLTYEYPSNKRTKRLYIIDNQE